MNFDVEIQDVSEKYGVMNVQGRHSKVVMEALFGHGGTKIG